MKKIAIVIIGATILMNSVNADLQNYYSKYSDYGPYTESYIEETDLVDVRKTTAYRYYKEKREYGDYYLINKNNSMYPYVDTSDFIVTNYSNWSETIPNNEIGRNIQTRDVYYYQDMKKVRYIHFTDLHGYMHQLNINEIFVRANGVNIPYSIYCEGCSENFYEKITNQKISYEGSYVLWGGYLRLDLGQYYNLSDLNILFYITDTSEWEKKYKISVSREESLNSNIYSEVLSRMFFKHNNYDDYNEIQHQLDKINLVSPEWDGQVKSYNPVVATTTRRIDKKVEYRYQDTLFHYYKLIRVYANDYYTNAPLGFPIKDELDKIEYYQSRYRDRVTIKKKIIINDKNQKLEDFVVENTTNEMTISSTINYDENGIYDVSYIFPFGTIDRLVYVNIEDNNCKCDDNDNSDPNDPGEDNADPIDEEKPNPDEPGEDDNDPIDDEEPDPNDPGEDNADPIDDEEPDPTEPGEDDNDPIDEEEPNLDIQDKDDKDLTYDSIKSDNHTDNENHKSNKVNKSNEKLDFNNVTNLNNKKKNNTLREKEILNEFVDSSTLINNFNKTDKNNINNVDEEVTKQVDKFNKKKFLGYNLILFPITIFLLVGLVKYCKQRRINKKSE